MEDIVRSYMNKLETATDDARVALASHGLPAVLDAMNPGFRPDLPEVAKVALSDDFVQRGLAGSLPAMTDTLRALREQVRQATFTLVPSTLSTLRTWSPAHLAGRYGQLVCELLPCAITTGVQAVQDLRQCGEMLDHEQALDDSMRARYNEAWARPLSRIAAASYRENIARYEANLQAAADSDRANDGRIANALPRLQALSVENVRGMLPKLEKPMVAPGEDGDVIVGNLRQIIAQLATLGRERAVLEEDLKSKQKGDNVLPDLLKAGPEGPDKVFEEHLAAFKADSAGVDANAARTNEALTLLQQYVEVFRKLYDVDGWQAECNRIAGAHRTSCRVRRLQTICRLSEHEQERHVIRDHAYALRLRAGEVRNDVRLGNDLVQQVGEGITFYSGMQEHVNRLKQMCNDYVMARGYDQERRVTDMHKQKDAAASEEAARRMQQMDVNAPPPPPAPAPAPPPPPPPAQHMYPQHMAPAAAAAPAPYSMYPPPAAPYGAGQPMPPPPGQQPMPGQYYQPQTYPQQPPPPPPR